MALDSDNIDGLNSLAQCVKLQKSPPTNETFEECYSLYQRALAVDPEDFETNFNIGVLLYEFRKDLDKAIHFFKVAINEEANATTLFNLAVIYEEKGDRNEAKKTYQEVLKLDPTHYKAKVNLAIIFEKEGKSAAAYDHYL